MAALESLCFDTRIPFNLCRFCAEEINHGELVNLTDENIFENYKKMLSFLKLNVDLTDNKMPKRACLQCHNKLLETFNFFLIVNSSQEALILLNNKDDDDKSTIFNTDTVDPKVSELKSEIEDDTCEMEQSTQIIETHSNDSDSDQNVQNNESIDVYPQELHNENSNFSNDAINNAKSQESCHIETDIKNTIGSHEGKVTYFVLPLKYLNQIDGINIEKYVQCRNIQSPHQSQNENNEVNPKNDSNDESIADIINDSSLNSPNSTASMFIDDKISEGTCQNDGIDILNGCNVKSPFIDEERSVENSEILTENVHISTCLNGNVDISTCINQNVDISTCNENVGISTCNENVGISTCNEYVGISTCNENVDISTCINQNVDISTCNENVGISTCNENVGISTCNEYVGISTCINENVDISTCNENVGISTRINENVDISTCNKNVGISTCNENVDISTRISSERNNLTEIYWKNDTNEENSWATYPWSCHYCKEDFKTMEELRDHSKYSHNYCYGFSCADCECDFNAFNTFVEHVRTHRECLRLYCQYCNVKFVDPTACHDHSLTHWHSHHICDLCGESLPDQKALTSHKKLFKRRVLNRSTKVRKPRLVLEDGELTWKDYEWSCIDCFKVLPDIQSLRQHTRDVHKKCFATKCADCLLVRLEFKTFVGHVREHRPYLQNFCQYCNQHFSDADDCAAHTDKHLSRDKICYGCGDIFQNTESLRQHILDYDAPRKYKFLSEEELTCNICSKFCKSFPKLKSHELTHNPDWKREGSICDVCGKRLKLTSYKSHMELHKNKLEICKICSKSCPTKHALKAHVRTHLLEKPYVCDDCGKRFKNKHGVACHLKCHSDIKKYSCAVCHKRFREKGGLKTHSAQHTRVRLQCSKCEKTFSNNPNLNKHMKRVHRTPFYKSKITPLGKLAVDEAGEARSILMDEKKKEWLSEVLRKNKRGKKPKTTVGD